MAPAPRPRAAITAADTLLRDITAFSRTTAHTLRPYQAEAANAILRSAIRREGKTFTVTLARQMGKNELSAQLEAYLLATHAKRGGSIVKAAPSFKPQTVNSLLRLRDTLNVSPLTRARWRPTFGYIFQLGRASCTFLSADPKANVVGATASLLLEIDEAQDVAPDKYDRDFRPMASATNATTALYGTAWAEDSLLERQKQKNIDHELRTGERLHFEYDWTHLAAINDNYRAFVQNEIDRLGDTHPTIQTQYLLHCIPDAGKLISLEQRTKLRGTHNKLTTPNPDETYVAGIDIAGAEENAEDATARALQPKRDSTVITIARLTRKPDGQPKAEVVAHHWWTGRPHETQLADALELLHAWNIAHVAIDASGIGYGLAHSIEATIGERAELITFSGPKKSELGYQLLAGANTSGLQLYADDDDAEAKQMWWEIEHATYRLRAGEILSWGVDPTAGHDDFIISLALCYRAATNAAPTPLSSLIRSQPLPEDSEPW